MLVRGVGFITYGWGKKATFYAQMKWYRDASMTMNERGKKGRDQWDKKHLKQSQNPSILRILATATLIHSFANLKDKTIAYIIIFIIHTINHGLGAYLDRSSKFEEE